MQSVRREGGGRAVWRSASVRTLPHVTLSLDHVTAAQAGQESTVTKVSGREKGTGGNELEDGE